MALLSADNRLRQKVCAVEGTVLLIGAGFVDRVIRFTQTPSCLKPFMTKDNDVSVFPVVLNLDRGPGQEAWKEALRDAESRARRDKPIPQPLEVSAKTSEGWAVDNEDVPIIEYDANAAEKPVSNLICQHEGCGMEFRSENALRIHKGRKKHE
jgi:hypothetical protein